MCTLLILIAFGFLVHAQENGYFINIPIAGPSPDLPQNDVWSLGSTQLIQWSTNFWSYNISLLQQNPSVDVAFSEILVFGIIWPLSMVTVP